jgi:hypothetical protein
MKQFTILSLGAVLLLGSGTLAVRTAVLAKHPKGDDAAQIRRLVLQGEEAARRKDATAIGRLISEDYQDGLGMRAPQIRLQVREAFRSSQSIQVSVPPEQVEVEIDQNGATGTVWLNVNVASQSAESRSFNNMSLTLRVAKEPVRYYWLFPGAEWRVTSAEGYGGLDF